MCMESCAAYVPSDFRLFAAEELIESLGLSSARQGGVLDELLDFLGVGIVGRDQLLDRLDVGLDLVEGLGIFASSCNEGTGGVFAWEDV